MEMEQAQLNNQELLELVARSLIPLRKLWLNQLVGHISQGLVRTAGNAALTPASILDIAYVGQLSYESKVGFDDLPENEKAVLLYHADAFMNALAENGFEFEFIDDEHEHDAEPHYLLVKYEGNWADELDVHGQAIYEAGEWEALMLQVKAAFERGRKFKNHIGTNEEIEYENFNSWVSDYDVETIPQEHAEVLQLYMTDNDFWIPEEIDADLEYPDLFKDGKEVW